MQAFCPECGTPIYSAAPGDAPAFSIRVGTARQRSELRPRAQLWSRSAQDWLTGLGAVRRMEKQA